MALSRCPRSDCSGTFFEMKDLAVKNSPYKITAIQCSICGAVVGTAPAAMQVVLEQALDQQASHPGHSDPT